MNIIDFKIYKSLVMIVYNNYELKDNRVLKHKDKWFKNDNKIYELYLKKGDKVELIYKEDNEGATYTIKKGAYIKEVLNIRCDMREVKERNRAGVPNAENYIKIYKK